jgi:trk system potassium uptake protein TrkA
MKRQQIAVIGLGRFGAAVAQALEEAGHEVLGIDRNMDAVEEMASLLSHVVVLDATEEAALRSLGLQEFDAAIVSIAEHLEASILATMLLKRLGVPRVVAKASEELHSEILRRVGADQVVFPERDAGISLAHGWPSRAILDSLDVVEGYGVHRVVAPAQWVGKTVGQLDVHARFGVHLFILARGSELSVFPADEQVVREGEIIVLAGRTEDVERALR